MQKKLAIDWNGPELEKLAYALCQIQEGRSRLVKVKSLIWREEEITLYTPEFIESFLYCCNEIFIYESQIKVNQLRLNKGNCNVTKLRYDYVTENSSLVYIMPSLLEIDFEDSTLKITDDRN